MLPNLRCQDTPGLERAAGKRAAKFSRLVLPENQWSHKSQWLSTKFCQFSRQKWEKWANGLRELYLYHTSFRGSFRKSELSIYDVRNLMDFNAIFLQLVCVAGYRVTQALKSTAFLTNNESLSSIFLRHLVQQKTCHVTYVFASRRFLVDKSKRTLKLGAQKSLLRWLFANQLAESWFHPQTRQDKIEIKKTCI